MKRSTLVRLAEASVRDDSGCVLFTGYLDRQGYGRILHGRDKQLAHRVAHEIYIGPIPDGMQVDHLCGVRNCVNPAHLEAVTPLVNTRRARRGNAAKTECVNGHEFTPENTRLHKRPDGSTTRMCRRCDVDRQAIYRERFADERQARRRSLRATQVASMPTRYCEAEGCNAPLPVGKGGPTRRTCSSRCKGRLTYAENRDRILANSRQRYAEKAA